MNGRLLLAGTRPHLHKSSLLNTSAGFQRRSTLSSITSGESHMSAQLARYMLRSWQNVSLHAHPGAHIPWTCPTCRQSLRPSTEHILVCEQGHTSLRAKEGYVHLLPSGRKPSLHGAGDSEVMVRSRRAFFDAGHYSKVAEAVAASVLAGVTGEYQVAVLDAGCGEGRYLRCCHDVLEAAGVECHGYGIDVSKLAVRLAARRSPHLSYAVASSYVLPFQDQVFDAVLSIFAPCPAAEICRVLKPGGCIVTGSPGKDHLGSIKALIYAKPQPFEEKGVLTDDDLGRFRLDVQDAVHVKEDVVLEGQDAENLLQMTPFYWKASEQVQDRVASMAQLRTTVHIVVTRYQKQS